MRLIEFPQSPESIQRAVLAQRAERADVGWIAVPCVYCGEDFGSWQEAIALKKWAHHVIAEHQQHRKEA